MTAKINKEYAFRFLGVALLLLAFAGWFFYDGHCGYPAKNDAIRPVTAALAQQNLTPAEWMNTAKTGTAPLVEAFRKAGFDKVPDKIADNFSSLISISDPKMNDPEVAKALFSKPLYSEEDIRAQFVSAFIAMGFAAFLLALVLYRMGITYTLTDEALVCRTFGKAVTYPLTALTAVDDSQWQKRGILKLTFSFLGHLTLDAWHYAGIKPIASALLALQKDKSECA